MKWLVVVVVAAVAFALGKAAGRDECEPALKVNPLPPRVDRFVADQRRRFTHPSEKAYLN